MVTTFLNNYKKSVRYFSVIEAGDLDASGYAEISNAGSLLAFTGDVVPAITSATYDLDITVDAGANAIAIALLDTDDWDGIATKIQAALRTSTSALETVAIVDGKIKVSSVTNGASSTVLIEAGTTGSGGGDLLDAITAIGATYTATLDTPVDGTEGVVRIPLKTDTASVYTGFFIESVLVRTSANLMKNQGLKAYVETVNSLDYITIEDNADTTELVAGDKISVSGFWYK